MSNANDLDYQYGTQLLNLCGCRILTDGRYTQVGIFSDLDTPEVRQAIENVHFGKCPVVYLDREDIAIDYRIRKSPVRRPGESFSNWRRRAEEMRVRQEQLEAA